MDYSSPPLNAVFKRRIEVYFSRTSFATELAVASSVPSSPEPTKCINSQSREVCLP